MTDQTKLPGEFVEYKIRKVERFIITKFSGMTDPARTGSTQVGGEYVHGETAYEVAYALARADRERLGYPLDDMRVIYPSHPGEADKIDA